MKKYLLSRPVNSLRKIYEPAYLGAKIQAQEATAFQMKILEGSLKKKLHSSEDWSYKKFFVFKGFNDEGEKEYRQCLAPSPTTATAEAYLLNQLAGIKDRLRVPNVYSYCLAERHASTNYQYYLSYYLKRNDDVWTRLKESDRNVAVSFDIKQFYPSVDKELLRRQLEKFRDQYVEFEDLTAFVDFSLHQIEKSESGIPIGTEVSHQLADIYLRDLDINLSSEFAARYFRYVDDITIVCDQRKVEDVYKKIEDEIKAIGLKLNEKKFAVHSAAQWQDEISNEAVEGEDFFQYCEKLANWMKHQDIDANEVSRQFRDEGFNLPFEKIVARNALKIGGEPTSLTTKEIVKQTKELKDKYKIAAESMAGFDPDDHSRGSLQKARRALNPLFYLLDVSEYDLISEVASTHKNLITQKIVSSALHDETADDLLDYPGSTVSSYCEIWKTLGGRNLCAFSEIDTESVNSHQLDSLTALLLHGLVSFEDGANLGECWTYLRPTVDKRTLGLDKFESEIEALRIAISMDEQAKIISGRQSEDEEIDLQALELGNQTISP